MPKPLSAAAPRVPRSPAGVLELATRTAARLETSLDAAATERESAQQHRAAAEERSRSTRTVAADLQTQWSALTDAVHRDEVQRAQQTLRLEQLADRIAA